jgi:succinate-acetate transporter protein
MAITFGLLLTGFVLLVLGLMVNPAFMKIAGYELIFCALMAWYMMAAIILNDLAGKIILPLGTPFKR